MRLEPASGLLLLFVSVAAVAGEATTEVGGHIKANVTTAVYPDDSVIRDVVGASSVDLLSDNRLNLEWRKDGFAFDAAYQLFGIAGDRLEIGANLPPGAGALFPLLPDDDRRLFDLTRVVSEGSDTALLHRMDRFWVGHSGAKTVLRFGRQALTWGNGLFYAPMDLVNPFDPATIDTEYKFGDDMLYGQYLRDNGEDLQAAIVFRRDPLTGDVEADEGTFALKYHGFAGAYEYDLLAAQSFGDPVLALGGGRDIGGAVWRADLVVTDTDSDTYLQFVTNFSYSWVFGGKNMSGSVEYFYSGFGQRAGEYSADELVSNPDLLDRLVRGQLFTLGRHYLAGSVLIEMTPLWTVTPVLFANAADPSALLQLTTTYSVSDNISVLGSLNVPIGPSGSEFGGIDAGVPGRYLSTGPGIFAQFAWYF